MPKVLYELLGIGFVLLSAVFFYFSVTLMSEREYVGGILEIFVGFALIRAGLELAKLGLLKEERSS